MPPPPPQTGVRRLETTYAAVGGAAAQGCQPKVSLVRWSDKDTTDLSTSLAKASVSQASGDSSDASRIFSTCSSSPVAGDGAAPPAPKKVSFRGGGQRVSTSSVLAVGGSSTSAATDAGAPSNGSVSTARDDTASSKGQEALEGGSGAHLTFERSSDGGLIFSTE